MRVPIYYHLFNSWGQEQESSFNTYTIRGCSTNSKISIITTFTPTNYCPFELLNTLTIAFLNANMYADLISRF